MTHSRMPEISTPEPCEVVPDCPVCGSKLTVAHNHKKLKICVCGACGTGLTIPDEAFDVARLLKWTNAKATP